MPYTKQTWVDGSGGGTPLSAARLNYIETGVFNAQATADAASGTGVGASGTVPVSNGSSATYQVLTSANVPQTLIEAAAVGTTYTFVLADAGKMKRTNAADTAACTWTIPLNSSVAFPVNTSIGILQYGTGQITVVGAAGVTLRAFNGLTSLAGIYADAVLTKVFTDTWWIRGRLV